MFGVAGRLTRLRHPCALDVHSHAADTRKLRLSYANPSVAAGPSFMHSEQAQTEFGLIDSFFTDVGPGRDDVLLGVGDDCALLRVPPGKDLAVSVDTMVAGVHFEPDVDPEALGHKALAVNLSDLAAFGASPAWVTLALTMPESDAAWARAFMRGFGLLAEHHGVRLVGGDTTRGPLCLSVQVHGFVASGRSLRRNSALPGDLVGVTGTLGDAALALLSNDDAGNQQEFLQLRLDRPTPRVEAGIALAGLAHAAIDISDGLLADLGHICRQSRVGARVELDRLPLSPPVAAYVRRHQDWAPVIAVGDDYELCFTVAPDHQAEVERRLRPLDVGLSWIGTIEAAAGVHCLRADGGELEITNRGYQHFS